MLLVFARIPLPGSCEDFDIYRFALRGGCLVDGGDDFLDMFGFRFRRALAHLAVEMPRVADTKKPAPPDGEAGFGEVDYLEDCIIGAGAGAGGFGQHEAASAEIAAAAMRNLTIFMLFYQLLVECSPASDAGCPTSTSSLENRIKCGFSSFSWYSKRSND